MESDEKKCERIVKEITLGLRKLKPNEYYGYPHEIAPYTIDAVIDTLKQSKTSGTCILADTNSHDMDWSLIDDLEFEGRTYQVWGCVATGSFMFQLNGK